MLNNDGKYFVTTPIYYVNSKPHIGTSYTTVIADTASRFQRMQGQRVLLVTGADEHSQNIADLAAELGITPRQFCDRIVPTFHDCWKLLQIQDYAFERTSDEKHARIVRAFWQRIYDNGDVYKGEWSGWYHTTDNHYLNEDEVPENPESNPRLKYLTEEAYYFRLSKYEDWLLKFHEANPRFVIPDFRRNEMLNRIRQGLKDICISRTSTDWGIRLPWDDAHVLYVWVDALLTYMTGSGFDIEAFERTFVNGKSTETRLPLWDTTRLDLSTQPDTNFWPCDLHIMAVDIPWFHAVIWPAILASYGVPPPKQMLVHGYWSFAGEKMSKSLGNVVDPYDAVKLVGVDGLRYFLLREVPVGLDGGFSHEALVNRYNYDLANDFGNLVHRTVSMLHQLFDGIVPEVLAVTQLDDQIEAQRQTLTAQVLEHMAGMRYSEALQGIWELVRAANRYIDDKKPWELKKNPERRDELSTVFNRLLHVIRTVVLLAYPVIPGAAHRVWQTLALPGTVEQQDLDALSQAIPAGHRVQQSEVLFQRVDTTIALGARQPAAQQAPSPTIAPAEALINIDDFAKLQLRVAEVRAAQRVEGADKLLKLCVFDGERERTVVAGIAQHYAPEELVGAHIVLLCNLAPRKLRGLLSEGMLLAASDDTGALALLQPARGVMPGAKIS